MVIRRKISTAARAGFHRLNEEPKNDRSVPDNWSPSVLRYNDGSVRCSHVMRLKQDSHAL